jgi:hypothetical protein
MRCPGEHSSTLGALQSLAGATFKQLVRDPALLLIALAALLLIVLAPTYAVFHFDEGPKVMVDTGLSTALLAGLLVALLGPARAVAYELEDRTALTLLSKPVSRMTLVLGKYLGVLGALGALLAPLVAAVLYVVRITDLGEEQAFSDALVAGGGAAQAGELRVIYLTLLTGAVAAVVAAAVVKRHRAGAAYATLMSAALAGMVLTGRFGEWRWSVAAAGVLVALETAVIAAVALAAAVRMGAVGTLCTGLGVMIAGHLRALAGAGGGNGVLGVLGGAVPGLEVLNALEPAAAGAPIRPLYVAWAAVYGTMYALAALQVGAALMHGREVA